MGAGWGERQLGRKLEDKMVRWGGWGEVGWDYGRGGLGLGQDYGELGWD